QAAVIVRPSNGDQRSKCDLDIVDAAGRVCVRISGLSSRVLEAMPQAQRKTLLWAAQWTPQPCLEGQARYAEHWVVLCEREAFELPGARVLSVSSQATGLAQRYTDHATQLLAQVQGILAAK